MTTELLCCLAVTNAKRIKQNTTHAAHCMWSLVWALRKCLLPANESRTKTPKTEHTHTQKPPRTPTFQDSRPSIRHHRHNRVNDHRDKQRLHRTVPRQHDPLLLGRRFVLLLCVSSDHGLFLFFRIFAFGHPVRKIPIIRASCSSDLDQSGSFPRSVCLILCTYARYRWMRCRPHRAHKTDNVRPRST